jgi:hypothetical protein
LEEKKMPAEDDEIMNFLEKLESNNENDDKVFEKLKNYLSKVPGIYESIVAGLFEDSGWWVKFNIDIDHKLAWNVVQEMGYVLNYLSLDERLPTIFKPVSPPPYLNGGPKEYLSWVIECIDNEFTPDNCMEWLEGRLPNPVDDFSEWETNDGE